MSLEPTNLGNESYEDFEARMQADAQSKLDAWAAKESGARKGLEDVASGRIQLHKINPYLIEVENGWNSREFEDEATEQHVIGLAESITSEGIKTPLRCVFRNGHVVLRDGECRLRAVKLANRHGARIEWVPVLVSTKFATEADELVEQYVANRNQEFNPFVTGKHFNRLLKFMDVPELARRVGRSVQFVEARLALYAAPQPLQDLVTEGAVSPTTVVETLRETQGDQSEAVRRITAAVNVARAEGSKRATRSHVARANPSTARKPTTTLMKEVRTLIDSSHAHRDEDGIDVVVTFSPRDWTELCRLLGLEDRTVEPAEDNEAVEAFLPPTGGAESEGDGSTL